MNCTYFFHFNSTAREFKVTSVACTCCSHGISMDAAALCAPFGVPEKGRRLSGSPNLTPLWSAGLDGRRSSTTPCLPQSQVASRRLCSGRSPELESFRRKLSLEARDVPVVFTARCSSHRAQCLPLGRGSVGRSCKVNPPRWPTPDAKSCSSQSLCNTVPYRRVTANAQ